MKSMTIPWLSGSPEAEQATVQLCPCIASHRSFLSVMKWPAEKTCTAFFSDMEKFTVIL